MFRKHVNITHEKIDGKDCVAWRHYVEGVNTDAVVALITPSGMVMLDGHSSIKKERVAGVMLDMARWWRRNKPATGKATQ